jgi:TPR repeat protein
MINHKHFLLFILLLTAFSCGKPVDPFEAYNNGDYKTAIEGLTLLAEQGDVKALTYLGVIYHVGLKVDRDLKKSFSLYEEAAKKGYAPAQYNLGLLYQSGLGTKQDYASAYHYFNLAAKQEHLKAKLAAETLLVELRVRTQ